MPHIPFREWTTPGLNSINTAAVILEIRQIRGNQGFKYYSKIAFTFS